MKAVSIALCMLSCSVPAFAEVTRVTIASRSTVANGQTFGTTGPYEKLAGVIEFALDPRNPQNMRVVDLDRAARQEDGRIHFTADLVVLRPADPSKGNGVLLFEVVNRGRIGLLTRFNSAPGAVDPAPSADFGNGFLMREGYTLVMVGWEFDIPPGTIRLDAPAIDGLTESIRVPFILDRKAGEASLDDAPMYEPVDALDAASTLTVRDHYWDAPTQIARGRWRFVTGSTGTPRVVLDGGFEPGRMYEVTFRARGARVVWSHIAGSARGTFNERFGMPVAGSVLLTPTSFPFTTDEQGFAGERGSLLQHYSADQRPKIFFTNTSVEYWGGGRAAALIHTSADGKWDLAIPENVRIYLLAGTQHGEAAFPPSRARGQQMDNAVPQREVMRALLSGLHRWTSQGVAPPQSRYPRLADGTLTPVSDVRFPAIPAVADPRRIAGPGQVRNGRVQMLPHLVPQVDADGNETGGIRVPDIAVPLATNTGWNFRSPSVGGSTEIYNLLGSYIPFALTKAEREARNDPRPSIAERYQGREDYLAKLRAAAQALVAKRYLLAEDVENVVERGAAQWEFLTSRTATSSQ